MVKPTLKTCLLEDFSDEFYKKYHDSVDIPSGIEIDQETPVIYVQKNGKLMGSTPEGKNIELGSFKGWRTAEWQKCFKDHGVNQVVNNITSKRIRPGTYSPERFLSMIGS